MKRLILGVTIGALAAASSAMADPRSKQDCQDDDTRLVNVTGSHIKQKVKKRNIIMVGTSAPVLVIDQKEMARNGNGQIRDQLSRYPGVQVSGGR
jgi:outer membrane cobalamin receptor